jgi:hypothetical protein
MSHPFEPACTVIYTVKIKDANAGAWYVGEKGKAFECILEVTDKPFGGTEIMFRVLRYYHPVRFIKQPHCEVVKQRIAQHKELFRLYGK